MTSSLPIDKIKIDGGTQSRAKLNDEVVDEYAQIIRDGSDFPPVTVFHDGKKYWLADGFHRLAAYTKAGAVEIPVAVHQGARREAILFSVGANAAHGLRRTDGDKRRAVTVLLSDKEWGAWSDRNIAKQCGVSHTFVAKVRADVTGNVASEERTYTTKHGTVSQMDTAKIGKGEKPEAERLQETFDRQRQETVDALPPEITAREAAKEERRALKPSDVEAEAAELEELREANAALEAEVSQLRARIAKFDAMRVLFEKGGFEAVIAAKDEEIRNLNTRVATESQDKASWMRSANHWKAQAEKLGINDSISFDIETGEEVGNG